MRGPGTITASFNDLMPYGIGDITHSSGHHDHFNQWMWQRLLWSPRLTVEEVLDEYCRLWFGTEAAASYGGGHPST